MYDENKEMSALIKNMMSEFSFDNLQEQLNSLTSTILQKLFLVFINIFYKNNEIQSNNQI